MPYWKIGFSHFIACFFTTTPRGVVRFANGVIVRRGGVRV